MGKKKVPQEPPGDLFGEKGETSEQSFEELLARLEEIVNRMENGGLGLAESLKLFEEGTGLIKRLSAMLGDVREKVLMLVKNENGEQSLDDFTEEDTE